MRTLHGIICILILLSLYVALSSCNSPPLPPPRPPPPNTHPLRPPTLPEITIARGPIILFPGNSPLSPRLSTNRPSANRPRRWQDQYEEDELAKATFSRDYQCDPSLTLFVRNAPWSPLGRHISLESACMHYLKCFCVFRGDELARAIPKIECSAPAQELRRFRPESHMFDPDHREIVSLFRVQQSCKQSCVCEGAFFAEEKRRTWGASWYARTVGRVRSSGSVTREGNKDDSCKWFDVDSRSWMNLGSRCLSGLGVKKKREVSVDE